MLLCREPAEKTSVRGLPVPEMRMLRSVLSVCIDSWHFLHTSAFPDPRSLTYVTTYCLCPHACLGSTVSLKMVLPSLIAFGSLVPWPKPHRLDELRSALQQQESLKPILQVIKELPLLWKVLSKTDPNLDGIAGEAAANDIAEWVAAAGAAYLLEDKGNVTRMPLTVITHIAQYISCLRQFDVPPSHRTVMKSVLAGGGVQGCCVGLLSALAVASGKSEDDVARFAAVSVRLAFCVGAYVDLDRNRLGSESQASNLAVRWKEPTTFGDIQSLLSRHSDVSLVAEFNL